VPQRRGTNAENDAENDVAPMGKNAAPMRKNNAAPMRKNNAAPMRK